jgi:hypothetical protein
MKAIKSLVAVFCALAVMSAVSLQAESCCDKAKAAGKTCEKCNPKKEAK